MGAAARAASRVRGRTCSGAAALLHEPACLPGRHRPGGCPPMWKARPVWPASINAARVADWPRLAGAWGRLEHDLALKEASGERAG
eukprot:scaffold90248_cov72-Phaeocystis_antarctica.AAC.1